MTLATISRTQLARKTRQVVEQVRRSGGVIVESYGKEQVAILDVQDYRLLLAMAAYRSQPPHNAPIGDATGTPAGLSDSALESDSTALQSRWNQVMAAYMDGEISLGRAARLLELSRYEFIERCHRLNIPLHLGPLDSKEALSEFSTLSL